MPTRARSSASSDRTAREDDGVQRHHTPLHAGLRRRPLRGSDPPQDVAERRDPARRRSDVPERPALRRDVRARQRARRRVPATAKSAPRTSSTSTSTRSAIAPRPTCRTGRKSASRWRVRLPQQRLLLLERQAGGFEEVEQLGTFIPQCATTRVLLVERGMAAGHGSRRPRARPRLRPEDRRGDTGRGPGEPAVIEAYLGAES